MTVLEPTEAVTALAEAVQPPRGRAAVALVEPDGAVHVRAEGRMASGLFEIGSLTKTMTATLLASLVLDETIALSTTVDEVLGADAGAIAGVTMEELATHTSGLPRLAPNAMKLPFWPRDPYRFYGEERLRQGLAQVALTNRGNFAYSNLGYDVLGQCLARAGGAPFNELLAAHVLRPTGMTEARCQPCGRRGLLRGRGGQFFLGGRRWHIQLPGAGGVDTTINDLARWAHANLVPEATPLERSVRLAQRPRVDHPGGSVGLAWIHSPNSIWHNGGTGAFQSILVVIPGVCAIAVAAAMGPSTRYVVDDGVKTWFDRYFPLPATSSGS